MISLFLVSAIYSADIHVADAGAQAADVPAGTVQIRTVSGASYTVDAGLPVYATLHRVNTEIAGAWMPGDSPTPEDLPKWAIANQIPGDCVLSVSDGIPKISIAKIASGGQVLDHESQVETDSALVLQQVQYDFLLPYYFLSPKALRVCECFDWLTREFPDHAEKVRTGYIEFLDLHCIPQIRDRILERGCSHVEEVRDEDFEPVENGHSLVNLSIKHFREHAFSTMLVRFSGFVTDGLSDNEPRCNPPCTGCFLSFSSRGELQSQTRQNGDNIILHKRYGPDITTEVEATSVRLEGHDQNLMALNGYKFTLTIGDELRVYTAHDVVMNLTEDDLKYTGWIRVQDGNGEVIEERKF